MHLGVGTTLWKRQFSIPSSGSIPSIPTGAIPSGAIPTGLIPSSGSSTVPAAVAASSASSANPAASTAGSVISNAQSVAHTFSSWNTCMEKSYCKWPVILGCVIGGLIVISIVWCFVRCCCCGMSFCCGCFSCCNACCGGGRHGNGKKYADDPAPYRNQPIAPAVLAPKAGSESPYRSQAPPSAEPPQYASFDVSRNGASDKPGGVSEDALPAMPSWETAATRKVLEEVPPPVKGSGNDMELGAIPARKAIGARAPMLDNAASPAGYGEPGMVSPIGAPFADPLGRGRGRGGDGYGPARDPTLPFGVGRTRSGGYSRLDSPVLPAYGPAGRGDPGYGQGRGDPRGPGGNFNQDPYARGGNPMNNQGDDYFGAADGFPPPGRQNTGGFAAGGRGQFGNGGMPMPGNDGYGGASTRSPHPSHLNNGYSSRSPPPMGQNNDYGHDGEFQPQQVQRSNTGGFAVGGPDPRMGPPQRQNTGGFGGPDQRFPPQRHNTDPYSQPPNSRSPPPPQRQNTGGYPSQQLIQNFSQPRRSPPPAQDFPDILTAGPKPVSPPLQIRNNQGPSYRAYTPPASAPAYSAYKPPPPQGGQGQPGGWAVI